MNCQPTTYQGIKREKTIFEELETIEELRMGKSKIEYFKELMQEVPRTSGVKAGPYEVRVNSKGRYYIHVTDNSHPLDDLLFKIQHIQDPKHLR